MEDVQRREHSISLAREANNYKLQLEEKDNKSDVKQQFCFASRPQNMTKHPCEKNKSVNIVFT